MESLQADNDFTQEQLSSTKARMEAMKERGTSMTSVETESQSKPPPLMKKYIFKKFIFCKFPCSTVKQCAVFTMSKAWVILDFAEEHRTVIDIHFFSIRSMTFYFLILIIAIWFWRTALIEYFYMFHTIFVDRILRFPQFKDNEGFLNTFWLNTWVSLQNSY